MGHPGKTFMTRGVLIDRVDSGRGRDRDRRTRAEGFGGLGGILVVSLSCLVVECGEDSNDSGSSSGGAGAMNSAGAGAHSSGGESSGGSASGGARSAGTDAAQSDTGGFGGTSGSNESGGRTPTGGGTQTSDSDGGTTTSGTAGSGEVAGSGDRPSSGGNDATGGESVDGSADAGAPGGGSSAAGTHTGGSGNGGVPAGGSTDGGAPSGGSGGSVEQPCLQFGEPTQVGSLKNSTIGAGPSGMVASRKNVGVLYAHLDAGGTATVFVTTPTGTDLGLLKLEGATTTDWEDIAVGPGPGDGSYLYVGDIGDNAARGMGGSARTEIQVYRFPEPDLSASSAAGAVSITDWEVLRFTYPDAAHDAETLVVDPVSGDIVIITKENDGLSTVFTAPGDTTADSTTELESATTVRIGPSGAQNAQAGAGDISPNGDRIIVRAYTTLLLWARKNTWTATFAEAAIELPQAEEPQSEGLTFAADGKAWYSAGERAAVIYQGTATCP
ncbi:MAG: hypothetical protein JW940_10720 [Polyangiaceae bacterium]|nr:hypothetical protein [Polyangiaceae bacterium]